MLASLSGPVSPTVKYNYWKDEEQAAFEAEHKMISPDTFLSFPDDNKEFHVYNDASNKQLRAVIMQECRHLAFYSRKSNPSQTSYTTGEQELLSIVESLT
jgi:hypothetical protein